MFSPMFLLQTIWDKLVNGPIREPIFVIHLLPGDSFVNKSFQDNRAKKLLSAHASRLSDHSNEILKLVTIEVY